MSSGPSEDQTSQELLLSVESFLAGKPHLQHWCSHATRLRYLRARNGHVGKASKMLLETLQWRDTEKLHEISWDQIESQARTGKVMRVPVNTVDGRPVLHLRPRFENSTGAADQAGNILHMTYQMEMASRYADTVSPDGKLLWIIDYTEFAMSQQPPLKTSLATLRILQSHFPERLHEAIFWHPPSIFSFIWRGISPFVDSVTKKKLVFLNKSDVQAVEKLRSRLDTDKLDKALGGQEVDTYSFEQARELYKAEEAAHREALKQAATKPS